VAWAESLVFEAGWRRYRRLAATGRNRVDVSVHVDDVRLDRYATLVARIPAHVADRIADATAILTQSDPGHYVYPQADLHLTVVDCSAFLGPGDLDPALAELSGSVGVVLAGVTATPVHLRGVNLFPASVYVQAFDGDGGMRRLRRRVRARFDSRSMLRDRVSFVNVVRFLRPAAPALVTGVAEARGTDFGAFVVDTLDLVLTDRTLSTARTTILERYSLVRDG
jgi:2'-5' RNA ligase